MGKCPRRAPAGRARERITTQITTMTTLCLAAILAFAFGAGTASAHASYVSSDPAANAVLKSAPSLVTIHFLENVDLNGSGIVIYDAKHQPVSGTAQVDRANLKTMTVPMTGDGSETYLVEWHTVSLDDGDPDIGAFTFTVNPKATTTTSAHTTAASSGGATPTWLAIIIGIAGPIIGGSGGVFLARRPRM